MDSLWKNQVSPSGHIEHCLVRVLLTSDIDICHVLPQLIYNCLVEYLGLTEAILVHYQAFLMLVL